MPTRLTEEQTQLLSLVRIAHKQRQNARTDAEAEARRIIAERMKSAQVVESHAVRNALAAGISKRRVGLEGLGTSDYLTVTKVLEVTEEEVRKIEAMRDDRVRVISRDERKKLAPAEGVEVPKDAVVLRIDWDEFEGFAGTPVDLRGYVFEGDRGRWLLVSDDTAEDGVPGSGSLLPELRRNVRLAERLTAVANGAQ